MRKGKMRDAVRGPGAMMIHFGNASRRRSEKVSTPGIPYRTFYMSCSGEPEAVCKLRIYDTIAGD